MVSRLIPSRRTLVRLTLLAALLGVAGALLAGSARRARADVTDKERCDLVGENHYGPLSATLAKSAFPERKLLLTMPRQASLSSARVHVFEDCQPVAFTLTPLAGPSRVSRYEVDYGSARPFGEREVELSVRVDGVDTHDIDYNAPAANGQHAAVPVGGASPSTGKPFLGSRQARFIVAGVVGLLLTAALLLFILPGRRRRDLRARVGQFTPRASHSVPLLVAATPEQRLAATERMLARLGWWHSFKESVELAHMERTAAELVLIDAAVTVAFAALTVLLGAPALSVLVLVLGPLGLRVYIRQMVRRQRDLFSEQLPGFIDELSSSMRAGHGLVAALATSVRSAPEPSRAEWGKVVADETLGVSLEDAMSSLARRMASDDVEQIALVANLHQRTGGNLAEVLDRVGEGVRERIELRRQLRTLSAQARMSRWVLTGLPVVLALAMMVLNPTYARPLFTTTGGFMALAIAVSLLTVGSLIMRKLTEIEV
jgi:tight adherence protein B